MLNQVQKHDTIGFQLLEINSQTSWCKNLTVNGTISAITTPAYHNQMSNECQLTVLIRPTKFSIALKQAWGCA
jgi:hypothetical protein